MKTIKGTEITDTDQRTAAKAAIPRTGAVYQGKETDHVRDIKKDQEREETEENKKDQDMHVQKKHHTEMPNTDTQTQATITRVKDTPEKTL